MSDKHLFLESKIFFFISFLFFQSKIYLENWDILNYIYIYINCFTYMIHIWVSLLLFWNESVSTQKSFWRGLAFRKVHFILSVTLSSTVTLKKVNEATRALVSLFINLKLNSNNVLIYFQLLWCSVVLKILKSCSLHDKLEIITILIHQW